MVHRREDTDIPTTEDIRSIEVEKKQTLHKQNGTIHMELGKYSALKLPASTLSVSFVMYPFLLDYSEPDPRMDGLPLLSSMRIPIIICLLYVCFSVVWGPRLMANRPAIKLKKLMMAYNLLQVVLNSYLFIQFGRLTWFGNYSYRCEPVNWSYDPVPFQITRMVYLYYLMKILDLMDTVFFVLNKKWSQITLLHIFHHAGLVLAVFIGTKHQAGGHGTFFGFINAFVHALMYSYYFLAAMGPKVKPFLWWKKYLTIIQLVQFGAVFCHAFQVFFIDCDISKIYQFFSCIYACVFFYLFMDFYLSSYRKKPKKTERSTMNKNSEVQSNGTAGKHTSSKHKGLKSE